MDEFDLDYSPTIDEALEQRKEQIKTIKEDFKFLWETYKTVSLTRQVEMKQQKMAQIRTYLYGILVGMFSSFYRDGAYEQVSKLGTSISSSIKELKEEKKLLSDIKSAIKELEKYETIDCNYDISKLLSLIGDKNVLLDGILKNDTRSLQIRLKGIDYASSDYKTKLDEINRDIDSKVQQLNLTRKNPNI